MGDEACFKGDKIDEYIQYLDTVRGNIDTDFANLCDCLNNMFDSWDTPAGGRYWHKFYHDDDSVVKSRDKYWEIIDGLIYVLQNIKSNDFNVEDSCKDLVDRYK